MIAGSLELLPSFQTFQANPERRISNMARKPPVSASNERQKPRHYIGTPGF